MEEVPIEIRQLISADQARYYRLIPIERRSDIVFFLTDATEDKSELESEIQVMLGLRCELLQAEKSEIDRMLAEFYQVSGDSKPTLTGGVDSADFTMKMLKEAISMSCSDIHVEPLEADCRVRYRLDGVLIEKYRIPKPEYLAIINRIKILSRLDISERRLPQDGRIMISLGPNKLDVRVSVVPTIKGEKAVLRLLGTDASHLTIDDLGLDDVQKGEYLQGLKRTKGIILISGPTGSGKTTTLYATLKELNNTRRNILTVEDPVEYTLDGISQVQAKEEIGLGFSRVLRAFLRQDPDIIMLGEIRDQETAEIAVRLALTGHLVLSTIHTNSSWGTLLRLKDMGIQPYLLADTIVLSIAQRLVRRLCEKCKRGAPFEASELPTSFKPLNLPARQFIATGCNQCYNTGYSGRSAIYELVTIDLALADVIRRDNIESFDFNGRNIKDLKSSAFQLFSEGITSLDEIYPILLDK